MTAPTNGVTSSNNNIGGAGNGWHIGPADEWTQAEKNNNNGSNNFYQTQFGPIDQLLTDDIAIDCEMVEATQDGKKFSVLARVSLVNSHCQPLLDTYVKPIFFISDYRTPYSGILPEHLEDAPPYKEVRDYVIRLINGRTLIGHDLIQDLSVLDIKNLPGVRLRDTSECYRSYFKQNQRPSLKRLASAVLGQHIQRGAHDSVEDARAAMQLYKFWLDPPGPS